MGYDVFHYGQIDVHPALSEVDARTVTDAVNMKETEETRPVFDAIRASEEPDLPGYGGQLYVSVDGLSLNPEDDESRPGLRLWLVQLLRHFFIPHGYTLNGEISFEAAEDVEDRGTIHIQNNQLETTDVVLFDAGPSWSPNHYADPILKAAISNLLNTADSTGCTPDLSVVSSEALAGLKRLLAKIA